MHLGEFNLFPLHGPESFKDAHHAEIVKVDRSKVIREVSHLSQELLIDHVLADSETQILKVQFLRPQFLLLHLDLLAALGVAQLQIFALLVIGLLLAIVGEDLLLLPLKLFSGLQLATHELLLLQRQLCQRLLHVALLGKVLRLYLPLLLLDLQQLGILRFCLKSH